VEATPTVPETAYEIAGMVGDAKYRSVRHSFVPVFFLPYSQDPHPINDQLLIRSGMPAESLAPSVRRALAEVDPDARYELYELKDVVGNTMIRERLMATLSSAFGVLAGLLSAIGLYGVIAYMVACRRNEIGIRMALGASRRQILALVLAESGRLMIIGVAVGTALSMAAAPVMRSLLFGLSPYDVVIRTAVIALLAVVGFIASYLPARRAAAVDPTSVLRDE
jgi:ABC-type antimicrobial peptide transport system permease subunit